ncbi:MAG: 1-acyl-sn-glycerol-3-phosphate acyltransferase [Actinobacteria bacterium]|nr:1-acyl-sn-glycerol-3-phosphate acyltransferase [Actinomycetota bacterium]
MTAHKREAGQLYHVAKAFLRPLFSFSFRLDVHGLGNVPAAGGAIMAPNHISVIDSFVLQAVLPRRITYVGKAEYMDDWKTKHLFPALGMIPIDRGGGSKSEGALIAASRVLDRGELFGIYPEGTRSRDAKLHKGHTGVARLALRTGCPIVPVGIQGTLEIQPPQAKAPKPFTYARIKIGRPIDVRRYEDRASDRLLLRQITDEVMYEIRELSGQEYVDTYATKQSEDIPSETARIATGTEKISIADDGSATVHDGASGNGGARREELRRSSADALRGSARTLA